MTAKCASRLLLLGGRTSKLSHVVIPIKNSQWDVGDVVVGVIVKTTTPIEYVSLSGVSLSEVAWRVCEEIYYEDKPTPADIW